MTHQLTELLIQMGRAGRRLDDLGTCEGSAGNISACVRETLDARIRFPIEEQIPLPIEAPELAGMTFLVSGSGCRLRDILDAPTANVGCLIVNANGKTAQLFTAPDRQFTRLTSEFNSHLAAHRAQMAGSDLEFHAVIHTQPLYITFISHIDRYQDEAYFNRHLLRWEPETIFQFPQGIGMLKFQAPGSMEMMKVTEESLQKHTVTVWARHGIISRSDISLMHACDRIEYAETAAHYEYLNLTVGGQGSGMSPEEIRGFCQKADLKQEIF